MLVVIYQIQHNHQTLCGVQELVQSLNNVIIQMYPVVIQIQNLYRIQVNIQNIKDKDHIIKIVML